MLKNKFLLYLHHFACVSLFFFYLKIKGLRKVVTVAARKGHVTVLEAGGPAKLRKQHLGKWNILHVFLPKLTNQLHGSNQIGGRDLKIAVGIGSAATVAIHGIGALKYKHGGELNTSQSRGVRHLFHIQIIGIA